MRRWRSIAAIVTLLAAVIVGLPSSSAHAGPTSSWPVPPPAPQQHPKLAPELEAQAAGRSPRAASADQPDATGRVVIEASGPDTAALHNAPKETAPLRMKLRWYREVEAQSSYLSHTEAIANGTKVLIHDDGGTLFAEAEVTVGSI